MPAVNAYVRKVKGLAPIVDPKQLGETRVVAGRNFMVDAKGPYSAFGSSLLTYDLLNDGPIVQTHEIADETFYFTDGGVFVFDRGSKRFRNFVRFFNLTACPKCPYSFAYVGHKYYFARRGIGLWEYDPDNREFTNITGINGVPTDVVSISQIAGRLALLSESFLHWSAIDNGRDFTPSLVTGAGAQGLSLVRNGTAQCVKAVGDVLLTFTTNGIMRSEPITGPLVFRHRHAQVQSRLLTAWCITNIEDDVLVFLTRAGIIATNGAQFQSWQPTFSEWLVREVLPQYINQADFFLRFQYVTATREFYLSIAERASHNKYTAAYVLSTASDEWGSFNHQHRAVFPIREERNGRLIDRAAYVDFRGRVNIFDNTNRIERLADAGEYYRFGTPSTDAVYVNGIAVFETRIRTYDGDEFIYANYRPELYTPLVGVNSEFEMPAAPSSTIAFSYIFGFDWLYADEIEVDWMDGVGDTVVDWMDGDELLRATTGMAFGADAEYFRIFIAPRKYSGLAAWTKIGPFRIIDDEVPDRLTRIDLLQIGAFYQSLETETVDWLTLPDEVVDWLDGEEDVVVDWGSSPVLDANYRVTVEGTLDGHTIFEDQLITPDIIRREPETTFYGLSLNGVYNYVTLYAETYGETFHLNVLGAALFPAGRI